ncbi:hypothetical protein LTR64_000571 [Lithohypha guttulata]|uniref:uncharacterized protein n=1 Tax=Lithohypha guttulata TaxID=1690604 RepID=UPI00315D632C
MDELHEVSFVNDVGFAKTWDRRLPQPDSDQSIAHLASRTLDEIELFVEEFYNNKPNILGTLSTTSDVSSFDSPHLDASLDFLLQKATSPTVLIKHCIAFFLLQKIDPSSNFGKSLLPREYIIPNSTASPSHESRQAISQIRVLMANTRSNPNHDQQYVLQRDQVAGEAVRQIEQAFQPWARGDSSKRSSALKGVIIHLSELGTKLFSQPSTFEWQWGRSNSHSTRATDLSSNGIVVLPGIDKTTDQRAELLTAPICLVKPRTASWTEQQTSR